MSICSLGRRSNVKAGVEYKPFANKVSKQSVITSTVNSKLSSSQLTAKTIIEVKLSGQK